MSDPLDHLLSVDLGESSPLSVVFEDDSKIQVSSRSKKPFKKVRFADTCSQRLGDTVLKKLFGLNKSEEVACSSHTKDVKGILKVTPPSSNLDGCGSWKGWSKPSPTALLAVNIASSTEDKNDTKSDYIFGENSVSNRNVEGSEKSALDAMDEGSVSEDIGEGGDLKNDEFTDAQLDGLKDLKINADMSDEKLNGDTNTLCDESREHSFDSDKGLLVDEIRKMSKELFVETASHLEDSKSDDLDGNVKSKVLSDATFISTDIVNDILDTHRGKGKLPFQATKISEIAAEICDETGNKHEPGDTAHSRETPAIKSDSSSRVKRPSSPHTVKLKRVLEEIAPERPTAKDLRTIAFSAWCAIKADEQKSLVKKLRNAEKQMEVSIMKEKTLKEASAVKAFLCWKEQKEKILKLKKENEMKLVETKVSKAKEDKKNKKEEADLVFKAWKKRKDAELREQLKRQKLKTKKENMNKGQSEEMKKLDAAAAFNAWKTQKSVELQRKEKECLVKKDLETSLKAKEKSERDKEAIKAYELWLEYKEQYEDRYDWRNQLENKPPWSPPGRIA